MKHYSNYTIRVTGENRKRVRNYLRTMRSTKIETAPKIEYKEKRGITLNGLQSNFFVKVTGTVYAIEAFGKVLKDQVKFI